VSRRQPRYTVSQVAAFFGLTRQDINHHIKTRHIKAERIQTGKKCLRLIPHNQLEKLKHFLKQKNTPPN